MKTWLSETLKPYISLWIDKHIIRLARKKEDRRRIIKSTISLLYTLKRRIKGHQNCLSETLVVSSYFSSFSLPPLSSRYPLLIFSFREEQSGGESSGGGSESGGRGNSSGKSEWNNRCVFVFVFVCCVFVCVCVCVCVVVMLFEHCTHNWTYWQYTHNITPLNRCSHTCSY